MLRITLAVGLVLAGLNVAESTWPTVNTVGKSKLNYIRIYFLNLSYFYP